MTQKEHSVILDLSKILNSSDVKPLNEKIIAEEEGHIKNHSFAEIRSLIQQISENGYH